MACGSDEKWLVLVLKDRFANDTERENLKNCLLFGLSLKSSDICYVRAEDGFAFSNFLFVREHDPEDLRQILEYRRDVFEAYPAHMRITGAELEAMMAGIEESRKSICLKHGDIVVARRGKYSKLNGIVLRESRSGKVEVGFKFCFGTVTEQYRPDDLTAVGNIFNYLKVLK